MQNSLLSQTAHTLNQLAGQTKKLGLAVSGGSDSLAMMILAQLWAKSRKISLRVACINHGLRPEAATETSLTAQTARQYGLDCDILKLANQQKSASQNHLRTQRHLILANWAQKYRLNILALGHTADDRLETMLMRSHAGSTSYGLAAPLPKSPSPVWPEGRGLTLIRPLAAISRKTLQNWLHTQKIHWCDDPSNHNQLFERVRTRMLVSSFSEQQRRSALAHADMFLQKRAETMRSLHSTLLQLEWNADGSVCIPQNINAEQRLIQILSLAVSGLMRPPKLQACKQLLKQFEHNQHQISCLAGAWFVKSPRAIGIAATPQGRAKTSNARTSPPLIQHNNGKTIWDGRFELNVSSTTQILSQDAARCINAKTRAPLFYLQPATTQKNCPALSKMAARSKPVLTANHPHPEKIPCTAQPLHLERALSLTSDPAANTLLHESNYP